MMRGTGDPDGAFADLYPDFFKFGRVYRRIDTGVFDIAETEGIFGAQYPQTVGVFLGLSEAEREKAEQFFADVVKLLPAFETFVGYAAVYQNQRNIALFNSGEQRRPEFRFKPQNQIRVPMLEKTFDKGRIVNGDILVKGAFGPAGGSSGRPM